MVVTIRGAAGFREYAGRHLGTSSWREVTQDDVDRFAAVADDWNWIHCDPDRARAGPYGGTIAHGFYTLALLVSMLREVYCYSDIGFAVNYGMNRLRFPAPVPVGERVRLSVDVDAVEYVPPDGVQVTFRCVMQCSAAERPVMIGDLIARYHDGVPARGGD